MTFEQLQLPSGAVASAVLVALQFAAVASHAQSVTTAPDVEARFAAALQDYERSHWREAYAVLTTLADRCHHESARLALQMWRYGRLLYRTDFDAAPEQLRRWKLACDCGAPKDPAAACTPVAAASADTP